MKQHSKKRTFKDTMSHIQKGMPPLQCYFSRFINLPLINAISGACAATLFRPYATIGAAVGSIATLMGSYLLTITTGLSLNGSEGLIGLLLGWMAGLLFEPLHQFIRPKQQ
ncbi:MAG: hypothetical protein Q4B06_03640 [Candidatus Saccharibacteria bacterium]|nr:hypothetical protein [Candidatus Saccharibacteria bacterium]